MLVQFDCIFMGSQVVEKLQNRVKATFRVLGAGEMDVLFPEGTKLNMGELTPVYHVDAKLKPEKWKYNTMLIGDPAQFSAKAATK